MQKVAHKGRIATFITNDMTGELIMYGQRGANREYSMFVHERWMWEMNLYDHTQEIGRPIYIEDPTVIFRDAVPLNIFRRYYKRRVELAQEAQKELVDLYKELDGESTSKKASRNVTYLPKEFKDMSPKERLSWAGKTIRSAGKFAGE